MHRFHHRERQPLRPARGNADIRRGERTAHIGEPSRKPAAGRDAERFGFGFALLQQRPVAGEQEIIVFGKPGERLKEQRLVFALGKFRGANETHGVLRQEIRRFCRGALLRRGGGEAGKINAHAGNKIYVSAAEPVLFGDLLVAAVHNENVVRNARRQLFRREQHRAPQRAGITVEEIPVHRVDDAGMLFPREHHAETGEKRGERGVHHDHVVPVLTDIPRQKRGGAEIFRRCEALRKRHGEKPHAAETFAIAVGRGGHIPAERAQRGEIRQMKAHQMRAAGGSI